MYKTGAVAVAVLISGCTVTGPDPMDAFGIPILPLSTALSVVEPLISRNAQKGR